VIDVSQLLKATLPPGWRRITWDHDPLRDEIRVLAVVDVPALIYGAEAAGMAHVICDAVDEAVDAVTLERRYLARARPALGAGTRGYRPRCRRVE